MKSNQKGCKDSKNSSRNKRGGVSRVERNKTNTRNNNARNEVEERPVNNPNWYFNDPMLAKQATSFSFNQFLGIPFPLGSTEPKPMDVATTAVVALNPSAGKVNLDTPMADGINMAAMKLYTNLSGNNAKTTQYAPQDVAMLLLAFGNCLSMISYVRRLFGLVYAYNQRNRVYPSGILDALGVNIPTDLKTLADNRLYFNTVLNTVNKIPIPLNIAYLSKCATLYDNIYLDDESPMAQTVVFAPYTYWLLDEAYDEQGSGLVAKTFEGVNSLEDFITVVNTMVNALLSSSTFNFIYSDILKLSSTKNVPLVSVPLLPDGYVVLPSYSHEVMLQFRNLRVLGSPLATIPTDIKEEFTRGNDVRCDVNKNAIVYRPCFGIRSELAAIRDSILNFQNDAPTTEEIIEATRYTWAADQSLVRKSTDPQSPYSAYVFGPAIADHYCAQVQFYRSDLSQISSYLGNDNAYRAKLQAEDWNTYMDVVMNLMTDISKFAHHPMIPVVTATGSTSDLVGDLNYYTTINHAYLRCVNDLAMQALFELR